MSNFLNTKPSKPFDHLYLMFKYLHLKTHKSKHKIIKWK